MKKSLIVALFVTFSAFYGFAQTTDPVSPDDRYVQDRHPQQVSHEQWAVVTVSCNFMREKPGYDEEMGDQALMGTLVTVTDKQSYWLLIHTEEPYHAWATTGGLKLLSEGEKEAYLAAPKFICTAEYTHIYSTPSEKSQTLSDFILGDLVRQTGVVKGKWCKILMPDGQEGWVLRNQVQDFRKWALSRNPDGEQIVATAKKFMGVPYMWGGTSIKALDCSGLSRTVYFLNGIILPRNASQQAKVGVEVPYEEAQMGDLIFYGRAATETSPERVTHVTIYMGGDRIIHEAQKVHESSLIPGTDDYYSGTRLHVRRILGHADDGTGVRSVSSSPYYFVQ